MTPSHFTGWPTGHPAAPGQKDPPGQGIRPTACRPRALTRRLAEALVDWLAGSAAAERRHFCRRGSKPPPFAPTEMSALQSQAIDAGRRSADFPVCRSAGFPTRPPPATAARSHLSRAADWKIGETADWKVCATTGGCGLPRTASNYQTKPLSCSWAGAWFLALGLFLAVFTASAQQTPPPEFTPVDGSAVPTNVVISCQDVHATVYFTTNGTEATTNGTRYTAAIPLTTTTTFRARAYLENLAPSAEVTATYYERHHLADLQKLVTNNVTPVPSIQLTVTPDAAVGCYAVEDSIPQPLVVQNITGGGIWDDENRVIRWGPFRDNLPRAFSYQVTHALDGVYEIWSQVSLNGFSTAPTDLNTKATVTVFHPECTVATPVFTPGATNNPPVTVSITSTTTLAQVYFTTDGRVPTTNDILFTAPLALTDTTFLRARGFREGCQPSEVASAVYWATNPPPPVRTITNATGASALVNLQVPVPPGARCFALVERLPLFLEPTQISDGGLWQADTRSIVWGPFRLALPTNLWYVVGGLDGSYTLDGTASFDGSLVAVAGTNSLTISNAPMLQLATPSIVPTSTNVPVIVTLSSTNVGAALYYTTNGALPTTNDWLYTASLNLTNDTFLRVRAFQAGWYPSEVTNATYCEIPPRPWLVRSVTNDSTPLPEVRVTAAPLAETLSYAVEERLPLLVTPSAISDSGSWNEATSTLRWGPFRDGLARTLSYRLSGVPGTHALDGTGSFDGRAFAVTGAVQVVIVSYLDQVVATPVLSPPGSTSLPVVVTISCATAGAEIRIHYTTDTTVPNTNSPLYTNALTVAVPTVLRARAFVEGMTASDTVTGHYETNEPPLGSIVRSVMGNSGLFPMCDLAVTPSPTVTTYAVEEVLPGTVLPTGITHGGLWDATTLSIRWGPFRDNLPRTLSYSVNAADSSFTPDGTASFNGWSTKATGESVIVVSGHDQQVATPTISPVSGTPAPVMVTLFCATSNAWIYYTINGLVPTNSETNNNFRYYHSFAVGEGPVRAKAFLEGMIPSDTASAWYPATNAQPAPVRSISGSPSSVQLVSIAAAPRSEVREYAVEEYVPWPLAPSGISHGSQWSEYDRMIRWGPFGDNLARTFSYSVSGPDGSYTFSGVASFDGRQRETVGTSSLLIQLPAPSPLSGIAGNAAAYLLWPRPVGVAGYYVYVWPDGGLYSQKRLDVGVPDRDYFSVTNLTNNTKYYFSVTAYDAARHESGRSENVMLVPSGTNKTLGFVWFDRPYYSLSNQAVVTVQDSDLNTDTQTVQTASVRITSDSDAWGFNLTLTETGTNTDVFTSAARGTNLCFTTGDSDTNRFRIKAKAGDRVWVRYQDLLPQELARTNSALVDSDIDQDSLPDWWEWQLVGNLTNLSGTGDFDGDGLTDLQEYLLGTSPIDPYTRGHLLAPVRLTNGAFQCEFLGETNRQYRVLATSDLQTWEAVTNVTGWKDRFVDPAATNLPPRFYRTVLLP